MIDKQKHANEFRLRILLTNECDKECANCLNDFQKKSNDFISVEFVQKHILEYVSFCSNNDIKPIISLSGGEPGLHPQFIQILMAAVESGAKVQVNTNGLIDKFFLSFWEEAKDIDIRYHMGHDLRNKIIAGQTAVFILQEHYTVKETFDFIKPFHEGDMKIKTFADYYASEAFRTEVYPKWLEMLSEYFPINGRHTGVQENRGTGCTGCQKTCVTLKALWLFPNNTSSFCPQRPGIISENIKKIMLDAYKTHLKGE